MKYILVLLAALCANVASAEMVLVANPGVKANSITVDQLAHLFLGQTSTFPDGSEAVPLDVAGDYRNSFYTYMLKRSPTQMDKYWARMIFTGRNRPPHQVSVKDVKSIVAETSGAISYMDRSLVDGSVKIINLVDGN